MLRADQQRRLRWACEGWRARGRPRSTIGMARKTVVQVTAALWADTPNRMPFRRPTGLLRVIQPKPGLGRPIPFSRGRIPRRADARVRLFVPIIDQGFVPDPAQLIAYHESHNGKAWEKQQCDQRGHDLASGKVSKVGEHGPTGRPVLPGRTVARVPGSRIRNPYPGIIHNHEEFSNKHKWLGQPLKGFGLAAARAVRAVLDS